MVKRFYSQFKSSKGIQYEIQVLDAEYTGTPIEFRSGPSGFVIDWEGDRESKNAAICPSRCKFEMMVEGPEHEQFIFDLTTSTESRFEIEIRNLTTAKMHWIGYVSPSISAIEDISYPYSFEVTAADGLGSLQFIDFAQSDGTPYGTLSVLEHVNNILAKKGIYSGHFGPLDIFIRTSVNWYNTIHGTPDLVHDPLKFTRFSGTVYSERTEARKYKHSNCLEVLTDIIGSWGARLYFSAGCFFIDQINERLNPGDYTERRYNISGGLLSAAATNYSRGISQTSAGARLAGGKFDFLQSLQKTEVAYKHNTGIDIAKGLTKVWGTEFGDNGEVFMGSFAAFDVHRIKFNGLIKLDVTTDLNGYFHLKIKFKVRLHATSGNDYYLKRDPVWTVDPVTGLGYWAAGAMSWETTANYCYFFQKYWQFGNNTVDLPFSILLPLPSEGGDVYIDFIDPVEFDSPFSTPVINNWELTELAGTVLVATPLTETELTYTATNPNDVGSETYKREVKTGAALKSWTQGRLLMSPAGVTWESSEAGWYRNDGGTPDDLAFGQLLANELLFGQIKPVMKYKGTLYGDNLGFHILWSDPDSRNWIFLNGSQNAAMDEFSGEFVGRNYAKTGIPGVQITGYAPSISTPAQTGSGAGVDPYFELQAPQWPVTTLYGLIADTKVSAAINPGLVTSIPVSPALAAGVFTAGQVIKIADPNTGFTDTLTVTATNAAGATSISVTGTLSSGYPLGSIIKNIGIVNNSNTGTGSPAMAPKMEAFAVNASDQVVLTTPIPADLSRIVLFVGGFPIVSLGGAFSKHATLNALVLNRSDLRWEAGFVIIF